MNDPSRLARLNAVKLGALVRDHVGGDPVLEPGEFPGGAALRHGGEAWVLLAERPAQGLGGALAWGLRQGASAVHVVAEQASGLLARRAAGFALPVSVWHAEGRVLLPGVAEPLPEQGEVSGAHREFEAVIVEAGAEPRVEFGVLAGEVAGLEVCRVVDDPYLHVTRLEVGVGAHDREAFQALHGDRPAATALAEVVAAVTAQRLGQGSVHPLSRLAGERLLRHRVAADPSLVGAESVRIVAPPVPRPNLKDPVPCVGVASIGGQPTVLVFTHGIDLDAVPFAVDARAALGIDACALVMPARDAIDVQRRVAAAARPAVDIVPVG